MVIAMRWFQNHPRTVIYLGVSCGLTIVFGVLENLV
jgi:hypothetical protein